MFAESTAASPVISSHIHFEASIVAKGNLHESEDAGEQLQCSSDKHGAQGVCRELCCWCVVSVCVWGCVCEVKAWVGCLVGVYP